MPCRDYETPGESYRSDRIDALEIQNNRLARIACEMAQLLTPTARKELSPEATTWWIAHQKADKAEQERIAKAKEHNKQLAIKAQKKRVLIAQMTKEQREILGL